MADISVSVGGVAWTDVVVAICAVAGTLAATFAGTMAFSQFRLLRRQVEQTERLATEALAEAVTSRKEAVKPLLALQSAALLPCGRLGTRRLVEVRVRNAGKGPAVDVMLQAWVKPVPNDVITRFGTEFDSFVSQAKTEVALATSALTAEKHLIGADDEVAVYLKSGHRPDIDMEGADVALVFVTCKFRDLEAAWHAYPVASVTDKLAYIWRIARYQDREPDLGSIG